MELPFDKFNEVKSALVEIRAATIERETIGALDGPLVAMKLANQNLLPVLKEHENLFDEILPSVIEAVTERADKALEAYMLTPERRAVVVSQLDVIVGLNRAAADVTASIAIGMHGAPRAALVMSNVFQWAITLSQDS